MVVAAGGDGTMNAVAGALADTETPMGVLPLGTLNHFAKDLNYPVGVGRRGRHDDDRAYRAHRRGRS